MVGAQRNQLGRQFLLEALLLVLMAALCGLALSQVASPSFAGFVQRDLSLRQYVDLSLILQILAIAGSVGLLAGGLPALWLSRMNPVRVLKAGASPKESLSRLRRGLVLFQFAASAALVIGAIVVRDQVAFVRRVDLGFTREQIVIMPIFWQDRTVPGNENGLTKRFRTVKSAFQAHPSVVSTTVSGYLPGVVNVAGDYRVEGAGDFGWKLRSLTVDEDFFSTYDIKVIKGRAFSETVASDATEAFILNETAVRQMGLEDPIGKRVERGSSRKQGTIIGLVEDFHVRSLREEIAPVVLSIDRGFMFWLAARIRPTNIHETLAFFERTWEGFLPERPFQYKFLNDHFDQLYYEDDVRLGNVVTIASGIAIVIACLGLFALASMSIGRRTREIGIRKALGASARGIALLLSGDFVGLVVLANGLAWPLAYMVLGRWLEEFTYRVDLGLRAFILAGLVTLGIAMITVVGKAMRAALADPVDALRYE